MDQGQSFLKSRGIDSLIYVVMLVAMAGFWIMVAFFSFSERSFTIERARSQLEATVITLADFNELADQLSGLAQDSDTRTEALWRALLQYPAASIWVESEGEITGGLPAPNLDDAILVSEARATFTVYAALPESEALSGWLLTMRQRVIALSLISLAFLALTHFLVRAMRQRALAEKQNAVTQERNLQLLAYRAQLENTVAERTAELKHANLRLSEELTERKRAEQTLREHDALLAAVTKGAEELLRTHSHEQAISAVLELIGKTISVSRVLLMAVNTSREGHQLASLSNEWHAPGSDPVLHTPHFHQVDISRQLPPAATLAMVDGPCSYTQEDIPLAYRAAYEKHAMRSFLQIPVQVEDGLWGSLTFVDSSPQARQWSWAETDALKTLADLIGVSMTRARYLKELADANMIVQNSPTILFRLKGEPSFPLIYISHNITKFGHQPTALLEASQWMQQLVVPDDHEILHQAMARMLEPGSAGASLEFRLLSGEGDVRWVENRYTPVRDPDGRLKEVEGIIIDITERKLAEEKIKALARTDPLTGLANRATFNERLQQAFAAARRGANGFAVFYLDLDHFKTINDTLGHAMGDELLKEAAKRFTGATRDIDLVARLGGDEFAILQTEVNEPANAGTLAQHILQTIRKPFVFEGNELRVTSSIGICPYSPDAKNPETMLSQADLALYRAKEEGRNRYRFHSQDLDNQVLTQSELAEELRSAIDNGELRLMYQPQVSIVSEAVSGMEALVRWQHPKRGLLEAKDFIPIAEKTGSIMPLGRWVLNEACRQLSLWRQEGLALGEITLNLSAVQLKNARALLDEVSAATKQWGLQPSDLEFDVTEAMLAQTTWTQNDVLNRLRELGCKISIDNFGTEYSSFDYLSAYAVNHLKIAKEFIHDALANPERAATLKAMIRLAGDLRIGVIVEGVETPEQRAFLLSINGGTNAQGYYYSRAVDAESARELLSARQ